MITLDDLNRNQRQAVTWNEGPLLVLAGPGSGKTAVLTLRLARMLEVDDDTPALALTFTNKAAAEVKERTRQRLGRHADRAQLFTFHTFAANVLGKHGGHLGIRPDFRILTHEQDRVAVLEHVIGNLPSEVSDLPMDHVNLLRLIDRLFSESYRGSGASDSLGRTPKWLPMLFQQYCSALVTANQLDLGSLLHFTNRLLRGKTISGSNHAIRVSPHLC